MSYKVIIPNNINPQPSEREVSVANILACHYKSTIEFITPIQSYKQKTPDVIMNGLLWEIKSPVGSSKKATIEKQLRTALKQSNNIIFDSRYTKLTDEIIIVQLLKRAKIHRKISKIILISKEKIVIELYKKR